MNQTWHYIIKVKAPYKISETDIVNYLIDILDKEKPEVVESIDIEWVPTDQQRGPIK